MAAKKLLLIYNPHSGKGEFPARLSDVADRFTKAGLEVTVRPTQGKKDAYNTIISRAKDFDCVCCSGGDGMVSEAVGAIMNLKKRPVFGYIPSGTTNDFASTFNIPRDAIMAADVITFGVPRDIDAGYFGGTCFAYVAAFGLFTDVTYATNQDFKNIFGHAAYMIEGAMRLGSIISHKCEIDIDGEAIAGDFIFGMASNTLSVGGFKMPSETNIQLDDGLFEVMLVKRPRRLADLHKIALSLLTQGVESNALILRQAKKMRVVSRKPLDWTLDGEFGGTTTDITIENKKQAFEIMVPLPEITIV
ncbi:MAG: diacylglycerol kinase family lipid kinase [Oscillospiraceae bacterium]|nr:diacylglycerol kinase family lipid kinase [Oscillospiraceae bacterium]